MFIDVMSFKYDKNYADNYGQQQTNAAYHQWTECEVPNLELFWW